MKTLILNKKNNDKCKLRQLDDLSRCLESLVNYSNSPASTEGESKKCRVASLADLKSESTIVRMNHDSENVIFIDFNK